MLERVSARCRMDQRDGHDRGGGIHTGGGDHDAAVDDEQVQDVMRPAPFVDHGGGRVGAHLGGAQQVPGAVPDHRNRMYLNGSSGLVRLDGPRDVEVEHPPAVLADGVVDLGRRDPVRIGDVGIRVTVLDSSGRSSVVMPHSV
jgi:hypothetical protein